MSYRNFLDELKKGLPSTAYMLVASDSFLHSEAVSLIKTLVPEGERDFNFEIFDIVNAKESDTPLDQIIDVLNTVPFFTGRKFVIIENSNKLLKKDLKKLAQYLLTPSESSVLVLLHSGALKKETKDTLIGVRQISLDISERETPVWLRTKAKSRGIELSDAAVNYLLGTIGPDLGLLSSELDKCTLLGKTRIEKEDIADTTEGKRTFSAFALVDALRAKDEEEAFRIYRVLRDTEEPYSLLGALNWQYGRLFAETNTPAGRNYFNRVFELISEADVAIKSSGSAYPMELLLVRLLKLSKPR
ncbi:MAG TPA: DNA polymerase III subunit delta [Candidatus Sulfobium mesophilum]|jgi:DNA polymerase III delta subunit|nr:DNA polymerase III subunit delta [Candidatus Sulfobium mesophilum]